MPCNAEGPLACWATAHPRWNAHAMHTNHVQWSVMHFPTCTKFGSRKLRPGCPPDYQIFCERIDLKMFIPMNLSSYLSLTNRNSSMRSNTTYILR